MTNDLNQLVQLVKGGNPQQLAMSMIQNNKMSNDPTISQLLTFAQKGDVNSIANIANNLFSERGMNFNSIFNSFFSMMK